MRKKIRLGVLDFGFVAPGQPSDAVIHQLCDNVQAYEDLGYDRFWLPEHHDSFFAYATPELLLPTLAERTSTIRLGTAGVLMQFHSPLRMVESFRMLEALYPGRIDLGIASGVTAVPAVRKDLCRDFDLQHALETRQYSQNVERLIALSRDEVDYKTPGIAEPSLRVSRAHPYIYWGQVLGRETGSWPPNMVRHFHTHSPTAPMKRDRRPAACTVIPSNQAST